MSNERKLYGAAPLTSSFSFTLTKAAKEELDVKPGDVIGFYKQSAEKIILLTGKLSGLSGDEILLGSSKVTTSFAITLPQKVRQLFQVKKKVYIAFFKELDGNVSIGK